jgi:soluble lytic murein transglycosylase-like protein
MNHHEQSEQMKELLSNQKVTPRWIARLKIHQFNFTGHILTVVIWLLRLARLAFWLALAYVVFSFYFGSKAHAGVPSDRLIDALVQVESSGNPNAVGDQGRAYGCLQIWSAVVCDVNQVSTVKYTHSDAFDPAKARAICKAYLARYCTAKRLGRTPTDEDYARCWNGGPMGYKKVSTFSYWQKVSKLLN